MSRRLKKQESKVKLSRENSDKSRGGNCEQLPTFSFVHLTNNKIYNFSYFRSSQEKERIEAKSKLYDRLEEISSKEWSHWLMRRKEMVDVKNSNSQELESNQLA